MSKVAFIVDHSNLVYRFKNALNLSVVENGVEIDTSVLYGYLKLFRTTIFTDIYIALDGDPADNKKLIPSYKSNRELQSSNKVPVPNRYLFPTLVKLGKQFGKNVHIVAIPDQEADFVISSLCYTFRTDIPNELTNAHYWASHDSDFRLERLLGQLNPDKYYIKDKYDKVVVASTDSDMYQLQSIHEVYIDASTRGIDLRVETPKAVEHLTSDKIPYYKSLLGDTSDCIPCCVKSITRQDIIDNYIPKINSETWKLLKIQLKAPFIKRPDDQKWIEVLANAIIKDGHASQVETNYQVATLRWIAYPASYVMPDIDLDVVLKRYGIKFSQTRH